MVAQEHGDCALYRHGLTPAQAATCTGPPAFQWSGDSMAAYAGLRLRAECRYRPGSLSCAGGAPLPRGRMLLVPGELPAQAKVVCTGLVCLLPSLDHVFRPSPWGGGEGEVVLLLANFLFNPRVGIPCCRMNPPWQEFLTSRVKSSSCQYLYLFLVGGKKDIAKVLNHPPCWQGKYVSVIFPPPECLAAAAA